MTGKRIALNKPQFKFARLDKKFRAYVGGYGSGKTWVGSNILAANFVSQPRVNQGYFAPTYPQIRDIFYPTVEEVAFNFGLRADVKEGNKEVHIFRGRRSLGTVLCRSMDKPGSIVGFKIGHALVDELDTLPMDKARQSWRKIIARLRDKRAKNGADVTTTPEGFQFVYQQFVKAIREKPELAKLYGLVQASTFDNAANLPEGYIESMYATYPPELVDAYLRGLFVNLTTGTIYHPFDERLNHTDEVAESHEALHIGVDFNVGRMAGITHVKRGGLPRAIDEIIDAYDTPDVIRIIRERYWPYIDGEYRKTREITIYPDASGGSRKSVQASTTDIAQLKDAGFKVRAPKANPPVKDRINAMNAMFCNANGERRYLVNTDRCPIYTEHLQQQVWADNGEPDKKAGADHTNDAGGYFIHHEYPLVKPTITVSKLAGF